MNRDDLIKLKHLLEHYERTTDIGDLTDDYGQHSCVGICLNNLIEHIEAELKNPEKQP